MVIAASALPVAALLPIAPVACADGSGCAVGPRGVVPLLAPGGFFFAPFSRSLAALGLSAGSALIGLTGGGAAPFSAFTAGGVAALSDFMGNCGAAPFSSLAGGAAAPFSALEGGGAPPLEAPFAGASLLLPLGTCLRLDGGPVACLDDILPRRVPF